MRRLLLDTNVALWLLFGNRAAVSDTATKALLSEENSICLSAVSIWEIAIKKSLGKLKLAADWYPQLTGLDFEPVPVTAEHARTVEDLPWHHRDPFDRLLIGQAMAENCALVTSDRQFSDYGVEIVW